MTDEAMIELLRRMSRFYADKARMLDYSEITQALDSAADRIVALSALASRARSEAIIDTLERIADCEVRINAEDFGRLKRCIGNLLAKAEHAQKGGGGG